MEQTAERKEAIARLAGHAGQLRWAMELDRADRRAGSDGGKGGKSSTLVAEEAEGVFSISERSDHFSEALDAFRRDFYDSGLMDRDYAQTIEARGGGRSGHELAERPEGIDLPLVLAVLTFLMRAERFVWGFWDSGENRGKLVRVLFSLRGILEGQTLF